MRVVLLDVEGTTTRIAFVTDVLFPFARRRMADFLSRRGAEPDVRAALDLLRVEHATDAFPARPPWNPLAYLDHLIQHDRKSPALKALQGLVWEEGYRSGELRGEVYADVPRAFARWREAGREIAIYSSGSVLSQRLLFESVPEGDLTPCIQRHFDTAVGAKRDPASYRRIAEALGQEPGAVLFVSDVEAELDAARSAGMGTALCLREEAAGAASRHPRVTTFDAL